MTILINDEFIVTMKLRIATKLYITITWVAILLLIKTQYTQ